MTSDSLELTPLPLRGTALYIFPWLSCAPPYSTSRLISDGQLCVVEEWCARGAEEGRPPGRRGVATPRPAWKALWRPWCLCLPVQSGLLISPIHPSLPALPAHPCACCSFSRYNRAGPRWLLLREQRERERESHLDHRRDGREAGGGQGHTRCILVKARDWLNHSFFLP